MLTIAKAVEFLAKYQNKKIFIVVKSPATYLEMIKLGAVIPEINVGGIYFAEGRSQISKTVYVDDAVNWCI